MRRRTSPRPDSGDSPAAGAGGENDADPAMTTISVEKMCCAGCAKKIAGQLYEVRGVKAVQCDTKHRAVFVTPSQGIALSPRALWEAVEKGEDRPLQLAGPHGTFTSKPRY